MEGIKLTPPEEEKHEEVKRIERALADIEAEKSLQSAADLIRTLPPEALDNIAQVAKRESRKRRSSNI